MKLYNLGASSASFRVRIALALKGLAYEFISVDLGAGAHRQGPLAGQLAGHLVPTLEVDGLHLGQSMAIIEYLDERFPQPPLLPEDALGRARVRALAQMVACEIHPLNNLRVRRYLKEPLNLSPEQQKAWYAHWIREGLQAVEDALDDDPARRYCHGTTPTLADCLLVPQVFNARRFGCEVPGLAKVMAVVDACMALPAFQAAQPSACPDFQPPRA